METLVYILTMLLELLFGVVDDYLRREDVSLVSVTDGDTVKVMMGEKKESVRLLYIDCFETSDNMRATWQAKRYHKSMENVIKRGKASKKKLEKKLKAGGNLQLEWQKRDKYNRVLGELFLDGESVNDYMLKQGGCMAYEDRNKQNKSTLWQLLWQ